MNKIFTFITMLIAMLTVSIAIPLHAEETTTPTWVGQGTSDSPYEISTKEHLVAISTKGLDKYYKLTADITLTDDWTPLGEQYNQFTGTLDGCGFVISGLTVSMTESTSTYGGLFGNIGKDGTVQNLGVTGSVTVTTGDYANAYAGGIAGQSNGKIMNCYTNVTVNVTSNSFIYAGGISGYMAASTATISNCFATGNCTATSTGTKSAFSGGILGGTLGGTSGNGFISYCFATGTVEAKGTASSKYAGGIAGQSGTAMTGCIALNKGITGATTNRIVTNYSTIANCYASPAIPGTWINKDSTAQNGADLTKDNFIGKGANEGAFTDWSGDNWEFGDKTNLPTLKGFKTDQPVKDITRKSVMTKPLITTIATADDLANFRDAVNGGESYNGTTVTLTADIDLSSIGNWTPIGNSSKKFAGIFDGSGHYINGLNVAISETTGNQYGGLFGYIDTGGTVQNLGVTGGAVSVATTGDYAYAGGIAGLNNGTINNCYTTVNVTANGGELYVATGYAGGISGNNEGAISNCYATGNITSNNRAGGIDSNDNSDSASINNCFATGKVEGGGYATGIAYIKVTNCIALNKKGITSNADNTDNRQYRVSTTAGANNYASPAIPGTWSKIGATAQDGADLTKDNFIGKGANEGAFTGWTTANWDFTATTNLPKLKTTGLDENIVIAGQADAMPTRADLLESSIVISEDVTYNDAEHKDKNIIVKSGGKFIIGTDAASLKKLTIEEGGQVVASSAFTCTELLAPRTLGNQWTAYGSPVEMKAVAGTSQTFHKLSGYTETQAWGTTESVGATSYDISKLNLIATETAADVSVTLTAPMSGSDPVSIPADKDQEATIGKDLNTGIFLFCANPTLKDVMIPVAYILSEDGTRFEQKKDAVVKPFQSYIVANAVTSAAVMSLRAGEVPTANEPVALPDDSFRLWGTNGQLHLSADRATDIEVYNLNGQLLHRFTLTGSRTLTLPRGVYLVRSNNITYKVSL